MQIPPLKQTLLGLPNLGLYTKLFTVSGYNSPGDLLSDLIKEKAKGGGTITLNLPEMREAVIEGFNACKTTYSSNYEKYIEPIRQKLISNKFLKELIEVARKKA